MLCLKALEGVGVRKAGGMGKIKNTKMNKTRSSSSVSSQITGEAYFLLCNI